MARPEPEPSEVVEPPVAELPNLDLDSDDGFERLDPAALTYQLIAGTISWAVFAGLFGIGAIVLSLVNPIPDAFWLWPMAWVSLAAFFALTSVMVPQLRMRRTLYRVDGRGLQIRRGLLWRSRIFVPRSRIQHTDVGQGPLERRFGLAHLTVNTAGTHNASTTLSGITYARALALRQELAIDADGTNDGV